MDVNMQYNDLHSLYLLSYVHSHASSPHVPVSFQAFDQLAKPFTIACKSLCIHTSGYLSFHTKCMTSCPTWSYVHGEDFFLLIFLWAIPE